MMFPGRGARLIGFVNPIGVTPAFVVPVFRRGNENELLCQIVGKDGVIREFRQIEVGKAPVLDLTEKIVVSPGEPSLWGFEFGAGDVAIGTQLALGELLGKRHDALKRTPLIEFQVAKFRGNRAEILIALGRANQQMEGISIRLARLWRELVIVPPMVKQIVSHVLCDKQNAIDENDVDELDVIVQESTISVAASAKIPQSLLSNQGIYAAIENDLRDVAVALGLTSFIYSPSRRKNKFRPKPTVYSDLSEIKAESGEYLLETAKELHSRREIPQALEMATRAFEAFKAIGNEPMLAQSKLLIAELLTAQGQLTLAWNTLQEAASLFENLSDKNHFILCQFKIAQVLSRQEKLEDALTLIRRNLPEAQNIHDRRLQAEMHSEIGQILLAQRKFEGSLNEFEEFVLPFFQEIGDTYGEMLTRGRIASALLAPGRIEDADKIFASVKMFYTNKYNEKQKGR